MLTVHMQMTQFDNTWCIDPYNALVVSSTAHHIRHTLISKHTTAPLTQYMWYGMHTQSDYDTIQATMCYQVLHGYILKVKTNKQF